MSAHFTRHVALSFAAGWTLAAQVSFAPTTHAQGTDLHRAPSHILNFPATDAEIVAALRGSDQDLKELTVRRAALVPPNGLKNTTVSAIANELIREVRNTQARLKVEPWSSNEGSSGYEYKASLAEVLIKQRNPAGIEGLVAVAHMGAPGLALVEYGEAAVPTLIKVAEKESEDVDPGHVAAVLDTLEQMLESPRIRATLSTKSLSDCRKVAALRLANAIGNDNWGTLSSAAYLAVSTGDDKLRAQVLALINDDSEFARRGIDIHFQQKIVEYVRQALAKFPN